MRRGVLIPAMVVLLLIDAAPLPTVFFVVLLGVAFGSSGHGQLLTGALVYLLLAGGLVWVTIIVAKAPLLPKR